MKQFEPTRKNHQNFTYKAPPGMDGCEDLHVTKLDWGSCSVWKISSIFERLKFLWTGEISLVMHGQVIPPVSLFAGDWYEASTSTDRPPA